MNQKKDEEDDSISFWVNFKKRLQKKPESFWIEIWKDIAIMAFFAGILISYKIAAIQVNHSNEQMFEELYIQLDERCPGLFINNDELNPIFSDNFINVKNESEYEKNNEDFNRNMGVIP